MSKLVFWVLQRCVNSCQHGGVLLPTELHVASAVPGGLDVPARQYCAVIVPSRAIRTGKLNGVGLSSVCKCVAAVIVVS